MGGLVNDTTPVTLENRGRNRRLHPLLALLTVGPVGPPAI